MGVEAEAKGLLLHFLGASDPPGQGENVRNLAKKAELQEGRPDTP